MGFKRRYSVTLLRVTQRVNVEVEIEVPTRINDIGREVEAVSIESELKLRHAAIDKARAALRPEEWESIEGGERLLVESTHVKTDEGARHHGANRERVEVDEP